MRYVYSFIPALFLAGICFAEPHTIQGEIRSDAEQDFAQLTVELQAPASGVNLAERTFVSADGRFQFRGIDNGSYLLVVRDRQGSVLHQEFTSAHDFTGFSIRLPAVRRERPISGLVSVEELRHKPPKAAQKAFKESAKRIDKGDAAGSLALLEHAVQIDPEYLQAWNNLGVQYVRAGRYDQAVQCFRRAIILAPKTPMLHGNLAQTLLVLGDYEGADASARFAIALNASDPNTPRAQLALGLALAARGRHTDAREVMVTCAQSGDTVVRQRAEGFLAGLH